jgi:hypothetical protein
LLADVLPFEHVLGALALGRLAAAAPRGRPSARQLWAGALSLSLLGFAFQTGRAHRMLADREGGRPMFEPSAAEQPRPGGALLCVGTDHGFNLAFRPSRAEGVARLRGDSLDRIAWEARGRPAAYRYRFDFSGREAPGLEPLRFDPAPLGETELRIEGESLWPAAHQRGAFVWPRHASAACASQGRWLELAPDPGSNVPDRAVPEVRLRLPGAALSARDVTVTVAPTAGHAGRDYRSVVTVLADRRIIAELAVPAERACATLGPVRVPAHIARLELGIRSRGSLALDRIDASRRLGTAR